MWTEESLKTQCFQRLVASSWGLSGMQEREFLIYPLKK